MHHTVGSGGHTYAGPGPETPCSPTGRFSGVLGLGDRRNRLPASVGPRTGRAAGRRLRVRELRPRSEHQCRQDVCQLFG
ncbi:hypothetical protein CH063_12870 [Colletotrichum higginsianum]|uniref:Uncharacterized protein n=1 Tax=Colletotrichum higginsianum (strain IMI 349063) TaxID=759273 RepID=H1VS52_COLHI|nr:hypothetical protein CH063_12870 [Colletotrichum higginsianum]